MPSALQCTPVIMASQSLNSAAAAESSHAPDTSAAAVSTAASGHAIGEHKPPELVLFELPVFVSKAATAERLLGGAQHVQRTLESGAARAEMWLRPDDPMSRSFFGDKKLTCSFLLRVERPVAQEPGAALSYSILGGASSMYRFSSLSDFQYLPAGIPLQVSCNTISAVLSSLKEGAPPFQHRDSLDAGPSTTLHAAISGSLNLAPSAYSLIDKPQAYSFEDISPRNTQLASAVPNPGANGSSAHYLSLEYEADNANTNDPAPAAAASRAPRYSSAKLAYVTFAPNEDVPSVPPRDLAVVPARRRATFARLREGLTARPVWTLSALMIYVGDVTDNGVLRELLPHLAYYVCTGAFCGTWVRLGFDPRADSKWVMYQPINVKIPPSIGGELLQLSSSTTALRKHRGKRARYRPRKSNKDDANEDADGGGGGESEGSSGGDDEDDNAASVGGGADGVEDESTGAAAASSTTNTSSGHRLSGSTIAGRTTFQLLDLFTMTFDDRPSSSAASSSSHGAATAGAALVAAGESGDDGAAAAAASPARNAAVLVMSGSAARSVSQDDFDAFLRDMAVPLYVTKTFDAKSGWVLASWLKRFRGRIVIAVKNYLQAAAVGVEPSTLVADHDHDQE